MTPALQPSAMHTTNHLFLITGIFFPHCPSPTTPPLSSCPTVCPSLCQGPTNFILIGCSPGWGRSASLSSSMCLSCLSFYLLSSFSLFLCWFPLPRLSFTSNFSFTHMPPFSVTLSSHSLTSWLCEHFPISVLPLLLTLHSARQNK